MSERGLGLDYGTAAGACLSCARNRTGSSSRVAILSWAAAVVLMNQIQREALAFTSLGYFLKIQPDKPPDAGRLPGVWLNPTMCITHLAAFWPPFLLES